MKNPVQYSSHSSKVQLAHAHKYRFTVSRCQICGCYGKESFTTGIQAVNHVCQGAWIILYYADDHFLSFQDLALVVEEAHSWSKETCF